MEAIYIPHLLRATDRTETIFLQEFVPGFSSLTPVRGQLRVRHGGTFLEIFLSAETIVTLTCDRCLQQYNHRLSLNTSELIWLDKPDPSALTEMAEREMMKEDLCESLPRQGYFDPHLWLYDQLSLAMPLRQLCSNDCQPPAPPTRDESLPDSRWASLEFLKQHLSQG